MTNWTHEWTLVTRHREDGVERTLRTNGRATTKQRASLRMWHALNKHLSVKPGRRVEGFEIVARDIHGPEDEAPLGECQVCGVLQALVGHGRVIAKHTCSHEGYGGGGSGHLPFSQSKSAIAKELAIRNRAKVDLVVGIFDMAHETAPIFPHSGRVHLTPVTRETFSEWRETVDKHWLKIAARTFDEALKECVDRANAGLDVTQARIDILEARLEA